MVFVKDFYPTLQDCNFSPINSKSLSDISGNPNKNVTSGKFKTGFCESGFPIRPSVRYQANWKIIDLYKKAIFRIAVTIPMAAFVVTFQIELDFL